MNWTTQLPAKQTQQQTPIEPDETEFKKAFAAELLKSPGDPFKAGLAVFPSNTNKALCVANYWVQDPAVKSEMERLKTEQGELAFLPTKADLARKLWEYGAAENIRASKEQISALIAFGEVCGYIAKGTSLKVDAKASGGSKVTIVASDLDEKL
jgi:hypothetical protein